ncbi:hypothetical protein NL108_007175 [Boleophthalmus pectinirostris]|nr:hypothetical protein NL108_007175 [Boleophthalmus pectinirostris]
MFEIIMTSGKKKMLAAESATLRKEWVRYLWKAMHLSTSGLGTTHRKREVCEQQSINSNIYADVECFVEPMDTTCSPADPEPDSTFPTSEEPVYQNFHQPNSFQTNEEIRLDGDYDILPARNSK